MSTDEMRDTGRSSEKRTRMRRLFDAMPTVVVLLCIAAVGAWGHATGWKAPRFSTMFGRGSAPVEDWCSEHNVPDSQCIACHPELVGESSVGWCKEHGVPESRCTVCHPEILKTGVAGDWCAEHGLPESQCTACHPEIAHKGELPAGTTEVTVSEGSHAGERAEDHPAGEASVHAEGQRDPHTCQKHALKVQFASIESVHKAGIQLGQVVERPMSDSVVVNAEVDYDRTRFATIAARSAGTASRVLRDQGAAVHAGEVLALVDSAEVGRAKAEYLQAFAAQEASRALATRMKASNSAGFRTDTDRLQVEAAAHESDIRVLNARQVLVNLGLFVPETSTPESILSLGVPESASQPGSKEIASANLLPVSTPIDGVVVRRDVVAGEVVQAGATLFEVADVREMWLMMDVPQAEAHRLSLGLGVIFRPDDARDEVATGGIQWISTAVDEVTRTVKVRAQVPNADANLRAHSFGRGQIVLRTSARAIAVPNEAVQWEGCCYVVFVRLSDTIFQTRKVRLGTKDSAFTEIVVGVLPGEVVVAQGSHVLKSEILKSSLGAGCTDD